MILPRQARDKHRENSKKDAVFHLYHDVRIEFAIQGEERISRLHAEASLFFSFSDVCPEPVLANTRVLSIKNGAKKTYLVTHLSCAVLLPDLSISIDKRTPHHHTTLRQSTRQQIRAVRLGPSDARASLSSSILFVPSLSWQNVRFDI